MIQLVLANLLSTALVLRGDVMEVVLALGCLLHDTTRGINSTAALRHSNGIGITCKVVLESGEGDLPSTLVRVEEHGADSLEDLRFEGELALKEHILQFLILKGTILIRIVLTDQVVQGLHGLHHAISHPLDEQGIKGLVDPLSELSDTHLHVEDSLALGHLLENLLYLIRAHLEQLGLAVGDALL